MSLPVSSKSHKFFHLNSSGVNSTPLLLKLFVPSEKGRKKKNQDADKSVVMKRLSAFHQRRRRRDLPVPDGRNRRTIIRLR